MTSTYFRNDRPEVRSLIPGVFTRALDVGCGEGEVGRALLSDGVVEVVDGIELDDSAADVASRAYDQVWRGTVESCVADDAFLGTYDLILCADVLEHLVDPWEVLRSLTRHLAPGGAVVVSIPNLRFAPVMVDLAFRGRFAYQDEGVLDRTHLRFFTRSSLEPLLAQAGLRIERIEAKKSAHALRGLLARVLRDFGSAQFVVIARHAEPAVARP